MIKCSTHSSLVYIEYLLKSWCLRLLSAILFKYELNKNEDRFRYLDVFVKSTVRSISLACLYIASGVYLIVTSSHGIYVILSLSQAMDASSSIFQGVC